MYFINSSTTDGLDEKQLFDICSQLGACKLYITAQRPEIYNQLPYRVAEPYHSSYHVVNDTYGFNPVFGIVVRSDMDFDKFLRVVSLMPIWEDDSPYDLYFVDSDITEYPVEVYSARWGDYHEHCIGEQVNLENLGETLDSMRDVQTYLTTPVTGYTECDMVLLRGLDIDSTIAVMGV